MESVNTVQFAMFYSTLQNLKLKNIFLFADIAEHTPTTLQSSTNINFNKLLFRKL